MAKIIGKPPINPFLFFTGKIAGYITWILLILYFFGLELDQFNTTVSIKLIGYIFLVLSILFIAFSSYNLGESTSLGVPLEQTRLKTHGIYKYSRNPMYVGFNLLTLSSIILTSNLFIIILGIFSIITYHFIILGEEKFLKSRFGEKYSDYCQKVRRYT